MAEISTDYVKVVVNRILLSNSAARISFTLGSITVDAVGFRTVAKLLEIGGVGIKIETFDEPDVGAAYSEDENAFIFPHGHFGGTLVEQMHIIHESVHALHDKVGGGRSVTNRGAIWTPGSENEATAYVAGALYALYRAGKVFKGNNPVFNIATEIAVRIWSTPGATVTLGEAMRLRAAIVKRPIYSHLSLTSLTTANG